MEYRVSLGGQIGPTGSLRQVVHLAGIPSEEAVGVPTVTNVGAAERLTWDALGETMKALAVVFGVARGIEWLVRMLRDLV